MAEPSVGIVPVLLSLYMVRYRPIYDDGRVGVVEDYLEDFYAKIQLMIFSRLLYRCIQ